MFPKQLETLLGIAYYPGLYTSTSSHPYAVPRVQMMQAKCVYSRSWCREPKTSALIFQMRRDFRQHDDCCQIINTARLRTWPKGTPVSCSRASCVPRKHQILKKDHGTKTPLSFVPWYYVILFYKLLCVGIYNKFSHFRSLLFTLFLVTYIFQYRPDNNTWDLKFQMFRLYVHHMSSYAWAR